MIARIRSENEHLTLESIEMYEKFKREIEVIENETLLNGSPKYKLVKCKTIYSLEALQNMLMKMKRDLKTISLYFPLKGSVDVTTLSKVRNLKELSIFNLCDADLLFLESLSKLRNLSLYSARNIILPQKTLANLKKLSVWKCFFRNFSALNEENLEVVDVNDIPEFDFSIVESLHKLDTLAFKTVNLPDVTGFKRLSGVIIDVSLSSLRNIEALKGMTNLKSLDISKTRISDLSPLSEIVSLEHLNIMATKVTDLTPLKGLVRLKTLNISNTEIKDVSILRHLSGLKRLVIYSSVIEDYSPLKDLKITELVLEGENVNSMEVVSKIRSLKKLSMDCTRVCDLTALKDHYNLTHLSLAHTKISDLKPLERLNKLEELDFSSTKVCDLKPLAGLIRLKSLNISNTDVVNISPLKNCRDIQTLSLFGTRVENVGVTKRMHKLEYFDYEDFDLTDSTL
jgi:internalin A